MEQIYLNLEKISHFFFLPLPHGGRCYLRGCGAQSNIASYLRLAPAGTRDIPLCHAKLGFHQGIHPVPDVLILY